MSENALWLEQDPELLALHFRLQRMLEAVRREPELEPWQVAERFGVDETQAWSMILAQRYASAHPEDPIQAGARFGRLVVLVVGMKPAAPAHRGPRRGRSDGVWCLVRCDCGNEKTVRARHLRAGLQSCGYHCPVTHVRIARVARPRVRFADDKPDEVCSVAGCSNRLRRGCRFDTCRYCRLKAAVAAERAQA